MISEQLSIYDLLDKSQELPPSETVAQVDETQEEWTEEEVNSCLGSLPSSDLDAKDYLVFNPEGYAEKVVELPTEDTDKALFSVGDIVYTRDPHDITTPEEDPETWFYLDKYMGVSLTVVGHEGEALECEDIDGEITLFYHNEIYKI